MPPRTSQKRKTDDSPYAVSGLKRTNGGNGTNTNALYPGREQRDNYPTPTANRERDREWYGNTGAYEKEMLGLQANGSHKRRKVDTGNTYPIGLAGGAMMRGEEGQLVTLDLSTLPPQAVTKYLQTYGLGTTLNPAPLSAQQPITPRDAFSRGLQNLPSRTKPKQSWEEAEGQDVNGIKTTTIKNTTTKTATTNGATSTMYTTTSALGLSATVELPVEINNTALFDSTEAIAAYATIAQSHWNSMSAYASHAYGTAPTGSKLNEREIIEDFVNTLRSRELFVRLST